MKISLGTLSSFNKKFYPKSDKEEKSKKLLEILNFNKKDIEEILPILKKEDLDINIDKEIEIFNKQENTKIMKYNKGCLKKFSANIDYDDIELDISVPFSEKDKKEPLAFIEIRLKNKNINIKKYKVLKTMLKTNGVKIEEKILDLNDEFIDYKIISKYPWYNLLMWQTLRAYNKLILRINRD